jgi:hypothetical protein
MKKLTQLLFVFALVLALVIPASAFAASQTAPSWMDTAINSKVDTATQYYAFTGSGTKYMLVVVNKSLFDSSPITGVYAFRTDGEILYTNHKPNIQAVYYQYDSSGKLLRTASFKIGQNFGIDGGGGVRAESIYKANLDVLDYESDTIIVPAS